MKVTAQQYLRLKLKIKEQICKLEKELNNLEIKIPKPKDLRQAKPKDLKPGNILFYHSSYHSYYFQVQNRISKTRFMSTDGYYLDLKNAWVLK